MVSSTELLLLLQVRDSQARQAAANEAAAAGRAVQQQLSRSHAAALEEAAMWQGRAQGLQQQLDQAALDAQQQSDAYCALSASRVANEASIRCDILGSCC